MLGAEGLSVLATDQVEAVEAVVLLHLLAAGEGEGHGLALGDADDRAKAGSLRAGVLVVCTKTKGTQVGYQMLSNEQSFAKQIDATHSLGSSSSCR